MPEIYYDPYDFEIDTDPHPVWRRMRDEAPLYRNDRYEFWALSRYEDVAAGLTDWRTYSSALGTVSPLSRLSGITSRTNTCSLRWRASAKTSVL